MPRYYSDKIFNHEVDKYAIKTLFNYRSEAKAMVKSALSRAIADRIFLLQCQHTDSALSGSGNILASPYQALRLSESFSLSDRNQKAKQSLQAFYKRSYF